MKQQIKRETLVDVVADRLRNEILSGAIPAGKRLLLADLVKGFAVSHIPIREALRRLEAEGLLKNTPRRGVVTMGIALDDLANLYDLRRVVEGEYAARAVARRCASELEALRTLHSRLERAETAADPDAADMWSIHREFHWAILAPAASPWVQRIFDQTWQSAERYIRLLRSAHFDLVEESVRQHRQLLEACEHGNASEIRHLIHKHLSTTEERLCDGYRALQPKTTTTEHERFIQSAEGRNDLLIEPGVHGELIANLSRL